MVVVLDRSITDSQKTSVRQLLEGHHFRIRELVQDGDTILGAVGGDPLDEREIELLPGVTRVVPLSHPYKLVSRELQYGIFQCRTGAVIGAFLFHRRYQVGDISDNEQVARVRLKQYRRIDAGIGARHYRHLRPLATGNQILDQWPALLIGFIAVPPVTHHQFVDARGHKSGTRAMRNRNTIELQN